MAQIVTITNPLTGQPAQVDQLEHTAQQIDDAIARTLPGGEIDITLQNKLGGIESADYPGCYYRMVGSVVEWFNPPMVLGKEYRTTERYMGKPVYTKMIDCGAGPNNSFKYVYFNTTTSNISRVISVEGSNSDGGVFPYTGSEKSDHLSSAKDYICIGSTYDRSNVTIYATIKYTKTTD